MSRCGTIIAASWPPASPGVGQDRIPAGGFRVDAGWIYVAALQRTVEALAGRLLHKQNFRRLIDQQDLVEENGEVTTETGGRPAKMFRFRREVLAERQVAETNLPLVRAV